VYKVLKMAGWQINVEKNTDGASPTVGIPGLGDRHSQDGIQDNRREKVKGSKGYNRLDKESGTRRKSWAKEIAAVVGQCTAIKKSLGQVTQVGLRSVQHQLGKQVCYQGDVKEPDRNVKVN